MSTFAVALHVYHESEWVVELRRCAVLDEKARCVRNFFSLRRDLRMQLFNCEDTCLCTRLLRLHVCPGALGTWILIGHVTSF